MRVLFYYRGSEHIGLESIMAYVQSKGHLVELIYAPLSLKVLIYLLRLYIYVIWSGGAVILIVLKLIWKPLFASTVNYELAEAEGLNPDRSKAIFTILMAAVIAISIKMVGLLLITGMLIIPAAMARNISLFQFC